MNNWEYIVENIKVVHPMQPQTGPETVVIIPSNILDMMLLFECEQMHELVNLLRRESVDSLIECYPSTTESIQSADGPRIPVLLHTNSNSLMRTPPFNPDHVRSNQRGGWISACVSDVGSLWSKILISAVGKRRISPSKVLKPEYPTGSIRGGSDSAIFDQCGAKAEAAVHPICREP